MRLDDWIHTWRKERKGYRELYSYAEIVDTVFVKICSLLSKEYHWMKEDSYISSFCIEMSDKTPVSIERIGNERTGKFQNRWEFGKDFEPTTMFFLGLILYELLYGRERLEKELERGREKAKLQKSLIMGVELDNVYQEFDDIIERLTRFDRRERTRDFYEFPSCCFKVELVEEKTGQVLETMHGLIDDFDETYQIKQRISTEKGDYEAIQGQNMEIGYSFLYKKYTIKYARVRRHMSGQKIENGTLFIEACTSNGEKINLPFTKYNEGTWKAKLAIPKGSYVPYISIALSMRDGNKTNRYPQIYLEPLPEDKKYRELYLQVDVSELREKNRMHVSADLILEDKEEGSYSFASQTLELGF